MLPGCSTCVLSTLFCHYYGSWVGACASLAGYVGAVVSWLVMAVGCGIEYYNARCDAVATPLITIFVIVSLNGLPLGRICGVFVKGDT